MNALILGILWIIYYAMHSALASSSVKRFFARQAAVVYHSYRLLYILFSIINFSLLLWFHMITPSERIFCPTLFLQIIGFIFAIAAALVFVVAMSNYQFRFWVDQPEGDESLITNGINGVVRHPLYFGVILFLIAVNLITPNWKNLIFAIVTVIYIIIGALLEERKLIGIYGNAYSTYRKKVKMLIPFVV